MGEKGDECSSSGGAYVGGLSTASSRAGSGQYDHLTLLLGPGGALFGSVDLGGSAGGTGGGASTTGGLSRTASACKSGLGLGELPLHTLPLPKQSRIPYRQARQQQLLQDGGGGGVLPALLSGLLPAPAPWPRLLPSSRTLCQLLLLFSVVVVAVQALSCGLFFCVAFPVPGHARYVDLREVLTELSPFHGSVVQKPYQPAAGGGSGAAAGADGLSAAPAFIPRIIHQTYRDHAVPASVHGVMRSWPALNAGWEMRFYDDAACVDYVRRNFPQYLDAYRALPKDVERSDFFRYMVVLRDGGVYADVDVECRQPLAAVVRPTDTMVVGWEAEVPTDAQAFKRHFVRKRQVLQWFFAAAPGHPVLQQLCDHIAASVGRTFSNNTNRDTLERTGPGVWTDVVLRHAMRHEAQASPVGARGGGGGAGGDAGGIEVPMVVPVV